MDALRDCDTTRAKTGDLHQYGTNVLMNMTNEMGALPTSNSQTTLVRTGRRHRRRDCSRHLPRAATHLPLPVGCKKEVEIKDGKYKGLRMESVEYESAWALGGNCGNDDAGASPMIDLCNDYGLDTIEMGNALSLAMEATEKGALKAGIAWGDTDAMVDLIHKIAAREGSAPTSRRDRHGRQRSGAPRSSRCRSRVCRSRRTIPEASRGWASATQRATVAHVTCAATCRRRDRGLGLRQVWQGRSARVGRQGRAGDILQNVYGFTDSLDLCKFSTFAEPVALYAEQYAAYTGVAMDKAGVVRTGERIYNLERYFNNLNGIGAGSDYLPARFLNEPATAGSAGSVSVPASAPASRSRWSMPPARCSPPTPSTRTSRAATGTARMATIARALHEAQGRADRDRQRHGQPRDRRARRRGDRRSMPGAEAHQGDGERGRRLGLLGLRAGRERVPRSRRVAARRGVDRAAPAGPAGRAGQDRAEGDRRRPVPARRRPERPWPARSMRWSRTASTRSASTSTPHRRRCWRGWPD